MSYTPPAGNALDFAFGGTAYTPPDGESLDFTFGDDDEPTTERRGLFLALFVGE